MGLERRGGDIIFKEVTENQRERASNIFPGSKFSTVFLLLYFSLLILLLRCFAVDLWMIYIVFFMADRSSLVPVGVRKLI